MLDEKWLARWICFLIPQKFREERSFESWIDGFEYRYSKEQLLIMKKLWCSKSVEISEISPISQAEV